MARGMHTRKRSRASGPSGRTFKKRRTARRRTARKTMNFTSQAGTGGGLRFRSKRIGRKRWNNMLWNNSIMKQHYRSNTAAATTFNTPLSVVLQTIITQASLRFLANPFYIAAGGAIAPDNVQPLPIFTGDVLIRGGMIGVRLTNLIDAVAGTTNTLSGTVYLVRTTKNYQPAGLPANVPIGWDPTLVQDFDTLIGKVVYRKTFLLRDADTANIEYRLRLRKVDVGDYVNDFGELVWIIIGGNLDVSIAKTMAVQYYYNLSFTADAV